MSSEKHANLGLHKWDPKDGVLRTEFNDNFGIIDEKVAKTDAQIAELSVNVRTPPYNAKGDGVTDDTEAFQRAIDFINAKGGGTLYVPDTGFLPYFFKDYALLCDNLIIKSNGATLKKNANSNNYYVFVGSSGNQKGYGSGPSNIIIDGINVEGSFADGRGASITLHHSRNVQVLNCTFKEAVISGHPLDLGGCSDVLVRNCWFYGQKSTTDREYVEAIQIDHSAGEGNGLIDPVDSYDGLACKNITVEKCKFLPLTIGTTKYPAPNPFGSHSRVVGQIFTNIKFNDNYVEDAMILPTTGTQYSLGWLHFYHIDGLEIKDNQFINTQGTNARLLGLYSIDLAISQADVGLLDPVKVPYTPVPAKNVTFKGNSVRGFKHANSSRLIFLQGREVSTVKYYLENIKVRDNDFIDCYAGATPGLNTSSDIIYADKVIGLRVSGNKGSSIKRLLFATDSKKIITSKNELKDTHYVPFSVELSNDVKHLDNIMDGCGSGFYSKEINKLTIRGNTFVNEFDATKTNYSSMIAINKCTRFIVKENDLEGKTSSVYKAMDIYGASNTGKLADNFITGFQATTINADSTNITSV